jgi:Cd2+/Zn2+-exporting ATPase
MCCGEEAVILQRRLTPLLGIEEVTADLIGERLRVKYDAALLSTNVIIEAVAETGMRAWLEHEQPLVPPSSRARGVLVAVSGAALAVGLALQWLQQHADAIGVPAALSLGSGGWTVLAFAAAVAAGGVFPARRALSSLKSGALDINVLMLVAVAGAMFLGEWAEAATVVFLFAIAQWLESRSLDRARAAIRALMDLTPDEARIRHHDHEEVVPVDQIGIGTTMILRPGPRREDPARRRCRRWTVGCESGAHHRRIAPGRQRPW